MLQRKSKMAYLHTVQYMNGIINRIGIHDRKRCINHYWILNRIGIQDWKDVLKFKWIGIHNTRGEKRKMESRGHCTKNALNAEDMRQPIIIRQHISRKWKLCMHAFRFFSHPIVPNIAEADHAPVNAAVSGVVNAICLIGAAPAGVVVQWNGRSPVEECIGQGSYSMEQQWAESPHRTSWGAGRGREESEKGVEDRSDSGARSGGDTTEELRDHVGVLVERWLHLLHGVPDHRWPAPPPSPHPSLSGSRRCLPARMSLRMEEGDDRMC
jgi:hypothetical protein